ncbi:hypothetical protein [Kumtagia ephedrae]|uniref:hypothetical protein n=1 Tax=Kumtagia ephedrae TaxID=2116701 RepID=UPI001A9C7829|nr:hypothetical protein [Mesorhizobium ephedrae]
MTRPPDKEQQLEHLAALADAPPALPDERTRNFLDNWIDANVVHASRDPEDADVLQRRFLTDAVAAGLTLDEVNDAWPRVERRMAEAKRRWAARQPCR